MKSMRGKVGTDVIFKGSEHLPALSRASVSIVIDNKEKVDTTHISESLAPYLVYDELTLSRVIYADGTSDYMLNDAKIRLKDVQELLSFAGIGSSAHTIINQGEADRILLATPKDKKEALEDALGLRVYHIRIAESVRKLDRVESHLREIDLLRKEIRPHLEHLSRMVKKIEQGDKERELLEKLLVAFFVREEKEIETLAENIQHAGTSASLLLVTDSLRKELVLLENEVHTNEDIAELEKDRFEKELRGLYVRKDTLVKSLGRLEGEKQFIESQLTRQDVQKDITISAGEFSDAHASFVYGLESLERTLLIPDIEKALREEKIIAVTVEKFFSSHTDGEARRQRKDELSASLQEALRSIADFGVQVDHVQQEIHETEKKLRDLDLKVMHVVNNKHEEELKKIQLASKLRELESTITLRRREEEMVTYKKQVFDAMLQEGVMTVGRSILSYNNQTPDVRYMDMNSSELSRLIERTKVRIEEASVANRDEVMGEFKTVKDREVYLTKEMYDIEESKKKLTVLIEELRKSLEIKFADGVDHVSRVFSSFFAEIFPNGKAKLTLVTLKKISPEGEEISEQGIDIDVSLPNKKVKELAMFSGGERTLVSIALLFAMSSITPPPFMVLDETDAPLDESNARKYGLLLKRLAEKSKLLVITHNRETMNHCDMLYGVTLGVEGASKLLSVSFAKAEEYAVG
jgi:chromosome segregation protein